MKKESDPDKCTYKYSDGTTCDRPITPGFKDKEGEQYCIFHARNDEKLHQLKQQMLEEISKATDLFKKEVKANNYNEEKNKKEFNELRFQYLLNYEGAYFPDGFDLFNNFKLEVEISFYKATFSGEADFSRATFSGEARFSRVIFSGTADFSGTTFGGNAIFFEATLSGRASFYRATFSGEGGFSGATFEGEVGFSEATFSGKAFFYSVTFTGRANFREVIFNVDVSFGGTTFSSRAVFYQATFIGWAEFSNATFSGMADFSRATFSDMANFFRAIFSGGAGFSGATFSGGAGFSGATFSGKAEFSDVFFIEYTSFNECRLDKGKLKFLDTAFFSSGSFCDISEGSNITFINCCFSSISFLRSRIADTIFSNCSFNMTEGWINKKIQKIDNKLKSSRKAEKKERLIQITSLLETERDKIYRLKRRSKRFLKKNLLSEHKGFLKQPHFRLLMRKLSKRGLKIASAPLLHLFPRGFNSLRKKISPLDGASNLIDFGEVRDNYMQLKVNMDRMKDYDLANDFYFGEMEMKRLGEKRYKPKRWFLALYKFLSGYGNKPGQAVIMFFLCMFLLSFPLLFMKIDRIQHNPAGIKTAGIKWQASLINNFKETSSLMLFNIVALSHFAEDLYQTTDKCTIAYLFFVQYIFRPVQIALVILAIRRKVKRGEE